jgi:hypothetical protein
MILRFLNLFSKLRYAFPDYLNVLCKHNKFLELAIIEAQKSHRAAAQGLPVRSVFSDKPEYGTSLGPWETGVIRKNYKVPERRIVLMRTECLKRIHSALVSSHTNN